MRSLDSSRLLNIRSLYTWHSPIPGATLRIRCSSSEAPTRVLLKKGSNCPSFAQRIVRQSGQREVLTMISSGSTRFASCRMIFKTGQRRHRKCLRYITTLISPSWLEGATTRKRDSSNPNTYSPIHISSSHIDAVRTLAQPIASSSLHEI
ncbi:hypothetical protein GMDG_07053 [Pseudogymnoascus destructans 20631-21]|uniref:Uncharacterized protein n=1 Tax=Pseudogymnoascus destructans (strain ATCC MYA-4855 / 20631-21) TaxID=658429 RepID=L8FWG7_PSED2|nr:hypothetical protein GMDG_07053 [Pseudogymnoascus destructans 20631-21]